MNFSFCSILCHKHMMRKNLFFERELIAKCEKKRSQRNLTRTPKTSQQFFQNSLFLICLRICANLTLQKRRCVDFVGPISKSILKSPFVGTKRPPKCFIFIRVFHIISHCVKSMDSFYTKFGR